MNTTDILGNTAEQTLEPLSTLGWFGFSFLTLLVLALCAFLALVFQQSYSKIMWATALFFGWLVFIVTSPIYRAVGPGRTQWWWWITAILVVLIIGLYLGGLHLSHADFPNLAMGLLTPTGGVIMAITHDSMTEQLASFPLAWKTFVILMGVGCVGLFVSSLSSRN